ncbi:ATP-binding protein [Streptomyces sp. NPDC054901]
MLRTWIVARLAGWHLHSLTDDLILIATELATNAVRHGGTAARITLGLRDPGTGARVVRLEVEDSGPGFAPAPAPIHSTSRTARAADCCWWRYRAAPGAPDRRPPATGSGRSCRPHRPGCRGRCEGRFGPHTRRIRSDG